MSEMQAEIPNGTRYYFGPEARLRRALQQTAMTVFDGWSYEEIATPGIDYYELFERGMGEEAQRAFRFTDSDGKLLALRRDVTSAIARGAATLFVRHSRPLRFCYAATIFKHDGTSHSEWRREVTQVGCELIGSAHQAADMEVLAIVCEMLGRFELDRRFVITLNDVEIFNGIAEGLELDVHSRHELRQLIDTRNAADLECFLKAYASAEESREFAELIQLSGKAEIFRKARRVITNSRSLAALNRLESLWRTIESLELADYFDIDLGDVARLDYYTGLTFKIYVEGAGVRIGSGGRYDNLTANFGAAEPALGFVCELDALTDLLMTDRQNEINPPRSESSVLQAGERDLDDAFREAMSRRSCGERVQIDFGAEAS